MSLSVLIFIPSGVRKARNLLFVRSQTGGSMKNLDSVFAAYLIGWSVFFLFYVTIAKRTADLRAQIDRLKNALPRPK
jgi:hypothetical protein